MENRPVSFTYYVSNAGKWMNGKGKFLKWGSGLNMDYDKPIQITFAVVEDDEGQVHRVDEDKLKFTDRTPDRSPL